ncbi:MAG: hypothetical protein JW828_16895 [Sedimentisphaerales bacterium]|nr:hypothetical protein [Sedimentisphaerales bacterium]
MFGYIGSGGHIRNLKLQNFDVLGKKRVGGLVGVNYEGEIITCSGSGNVTGESIVGGLIGENYKGTVFTCSSELTVTGARYLGGLVGMNAGKIERSFAVGGINGTEVSDYVGGLAGTNQGDKGNINNCYATGTVRGGVEVGGLVGGVTSATIKNCYSTGSVTGGLRVGGLVGWYYKQITIACFSDKQTTGQDSSRGGGISLTTAQMQTLSTYTNAGWDFVGEDTNGTEDIWRMCAVGMDYPRLAWEFSRRGDLTCPDGVMLEDLLYLADRWQGMTPMIVGAADADGDGKVTFSDFAILSKNWLNSPAP